MDRHRGLTVLERREVLGAGHRNRGVLRDHLLNETAHRLKTKRKRSDIEKEEIVFHFVASELIRLDRGADRHHLIGIDAGERLFPKVVADQTRHHRHAGRAADKHNALHISGIELCVSERRADRVKRLLKQRLRGVLKFSAAERK